MDTSVIYSQLIQFDESDTESSDETSGTCCLPIKPLAPNVEHEIHTNMYDTYDTCSKNYLSYLQPFQVDPPTLHPHVMFKNPLISDTHLGFAQNEKLKQELMKQQKDRYNWLYHDPLDPMITCHQPEPPSTYVNLSDVNSYVAKIDSIKYSTVFPYNDPPPLYQPEILSENIFQDSDENDSMFSDNSEDEWPFYDILSSTDPVHPSIDKKLMIKIKKPLSLNSLCTQLYPDWATTNQPVIPLTAYRKCRKSVPNLQTAFAKKSRVNGSRRGSAPTNLIRKSASNLSTMASSSSLSSLSSHLKKTMKVSDSLNSLLTQDEEDEENEQIFETEDEDDDDCQIKKKSKAAAALLKKGKNVDKACNHCKRSHLRCDEMRPCRRCITTGKVGCRDVQHKPRGRPKLLKSQE